MFESCIVCLYQKWLVETLSFWNSKITYPNEKTKARKEKTEKERSIDEILM